MPFIEVTEIRFPHLTRDAELAEIERVVTRKLSARLDDYVDRLRALGFTEARIAEAVSGVREDYAEAKAIFLRETAKIVDAYRAAGAP